MKKRCELLFALVLLAALLTGCGGSGYATSTASSYNSAPAEYKENAGAADYANAVEGGGWMPVPEPEEAQASGGTIPANVKMIYTASIALESTDFDAAADGLEALTAELGGWFESSRLDNNSRNYRRATYTVRVPSENFESFCSRAGALCKVNSLERGKEDVSERYYDMESRLATQRTKLERLQALLAQAENMEDIITLETAISETELAIENLTGSLRKYDSLVNYSTIYITLNEVYQLTQTEEPAIGFGAKLGAAFRSGSRSFVNGVQDLLLGFARGWAGWLVFFAIVALVVVLIVRRNRRRRERRDGAGVEKPRRARRKRRAAAAPPETEAEQTENE